MIVAAARNGWLDLDRAMMESLISIRRAGADFISDLFRQGRGAGAGVKQRHRPRMDADGRELKRRFWRPVPSRARQRAVS